LGGGGPWKWWALGLPMNPHPITCDYLWKEFWVPLKPSLKVLARVDTILLLLSWQPGKNLLAIWHMCRLSFKILRPPNVL
jgi:hypothetical protein